MRLLFFMLSCLPYVCTYVTTRKPKQGLTWTLIYGSCVKTCGNNQILVKNGQEWRVFYKKTFTNFCPHPQRWIPTYFGGKMKHPITKTRSELLLWLSRKMEVVPILSWVEYRVPLEWLWSDLVFQVITVEPVIESLFGVPFEQFNVISTRSPFLPCLSRSTQSGRRTSFGRRGWFTESHLVLVILRLFLDLFIRLYSIQKACFYQAKQLNHFLLKYQSYFTCTPTRRSRARLLSHWTASSRCLLPTVSSFKSLSAHSLSYLSPTVLEHTLTVSTYNVWLWTVRNWCKRT
jgi:hypothetical protein